MCMYVLCMHYFVTACLCCLGAVLFTTSVNLLPQLVITLQNCHSLKPTVRVGAYILHDCKVTC